MISKLPKWVEYGAFLLACIAGLVNAVGLLGFEHQSISHLSGTATLLGVGLQNGTAEKEWHLLVILLSFLGGASISGFVLTDSSLKLGRHYDSLLAVEGLLLLLSVYLLTHGEISGHYFASAACGLQNALATTYSGAIVRTTHVTGIFTDLGIMLGAKVRGNSFDRRKAILFVLILCGFVVGGCVGAYLFQLFQFYALVVPSVMCLMLAMSYRIYQFQLTK